MAFGFPAKYTKDIQLKELNAEQFLVMAIETLKEVDWSISFVNKNCLVAHTRFSFTSWGEDVTFTIENDTVHIKSSCLAAQVFDWGKNKGNVEDFIWEFKKIREKLSEEYIFTRIAELENLFAEQGNNIEHTPFEVDKKKESLLSIFIPKKGYFITPILININILVFILMAISGVNILEPDNVSLLNWGANFRPLTLGGQGWRLLTACFLHIGVLHLLANMYALFFIGLILEPFLGKARFLAAYLLAGVASSLVSLWWHDLTISAGASGAIFGMYGVFLALVTTNILKKSIRNTLWISIAIFVVYNLVYGLKGGGIDNAAHIGGLLSGIIIGYAFVPSMRKKLSNKIKYITIAVLTSVVLCSSFVMLTKLPNDIAKYDEEMKKFAEYESKALRYFYLPENTPKEVILSELKDSGTYYWNENLKIIQKVEKLDLPDKLKERNALLKEYCELRILNGEAMYKTIDEETDIYHKEINAYGDKMVEIIDKLSEVK